MAYPRAALPSMSDKSEGEEFPLFRRFWIEKPPVGAAKIVIHALLDSPSVTGAYRFEVTPGWPTAIDVQATLYPRRDLSDVGIAPMTSMFLFSPINRSRISDFRPAVHDSDDSPSSMVGASISGARSTIRAACRRATSSTATPRGLG